MSTVMKVRRAIAIITILAGSAGYKFGPSTWHKFNAHPAPVTVAGAGTNSAAAKLAANDVGEVTLTNHYETTVNLGHGKNCLVVPRKIDGHNVELTLSLESRTPNGTVQDLTVTHVTAKTGQPMEVAVGNFQFTMTPKLVME